MRLDVNFFEFYADAIGGTVPVSMYIAIIPRDNESLLRLQPGIKAAKHSTLNQFIIYSI